MYMYMYMYIRACHLGGDAQEGLKAVLEPRPQGQTLTGARRDPEGGQVKGDGQGLEAFQQRPCGPGVAPRPIGAPPVGLHRLQVLERMRCCLEHHLCMCVCMYILYKDIDIDIDIDTHTDTDIDIDIDIDR